MLSGHVNEACGFLKSPEKVCRRQRYVRGTDGIAARIEQRAVEDIGISERKSTSFAACAVWLMSIVTL